MVRFVLSVLVGVLLTIGAQKVTRALRPAAKPPAFDTVAYAAHGEHVRAIWRLSRATPDIIMVGDSITRGAPWHELTGCPGVATRAMGGEYSAHILARVADLVAERPKAIVLMVGINDLSIGVPPATTAANVAGIVQALRAAGIAVYRIPVLPVTATYRSPGITNATIDELNRTVLTATDAPIIDLRSALSPAGILDPRHTTDGLHLSASGYAVWRDALAPTVQRHCSRD